MLTDVLNVWKRGKSIPGVGVCSWLLAAISGTVCSVEVEKMPLGRVLTLRRRQSRRRVPYIFHSLPDIRENLVEQRRPQLHPPSVAIVSEPSPW